MELTQLASQKNVVHCPYNASHSMPYKTLALHLIKCPDKPKNYTQCSFNNLHVMPVQLREEHEMTCLDRIGIDEMIYEQADTVRPITIIQKLPSVETNESWDEPVSSPNLVKTINQRPNFMKPTYGLTKSERKKNRSKLRSTYSNIDLSYNASSSIITRQDASLLDKTSEPQQEQQLFIGKRPNV